MARGLHTSIAPRYPPSLKQVCDNNIKPYCFIGSKSGICMYAISLYSLFTFDRLRFGILNGEMNWQRERAYPSIHWPDWKVCFLRAEEIFQSQICALGTSPSPPQVK